MITEQDLIERICETGKIEAPFKFGVRLGPDGRFRPIAGNTIVRHVTRPSRSMEILKGVQEALKAAPYGDHFTYLPPDSFHMTVFEGVIDDRRQQHHWPDGVSYSAPIEETTALYRGRLETFEAPAPFAMTVKSVTPFGLTLQGATPQDEALARAWRDALVAPMGYRSPSHDTYQFHITLAYCLKWLPNQAASAYAALLNDLLAHVREQLPVIELDPPAFCEFADLTHFEELLPL